MSRLTKGLVLAALHVALVMGITAKYAIDRQTLPRVWARTLPYDPNLPIRGRYVRLRVEVEGRSLTRQREWVKLSVENDKLVATKADSETGLRASRPPDGSFALDEALAFFIPEHVKDPSRREEGEELWVEVTVPRKGPPRPIRLGVKKDGGPIAPLPLD